MGALALLNETFTAILPMRIMAKRKSYKQSCQHLIKAGWIEGDVSPKPDRVPTN
jgi:hypothetical protein